MRTLEGSAPLRNRYAWLFFAILSTLLVMLGLKDAVETGTDTVTSPAQRPNILMIVADDLGYNDISSINQGGIRTPSIDQLAQNGILFTRFYADSICAPSRVGLLTGREPERSGFRPGSAGIPEEFTTLPELLVRAGYQTKLVGKWHAGTAHRRSWPDQHGFQHWFGFLDQWRLQVPADKFGDQARPSYRQPWLQRDSALPDRHSGHLTDILLRESQSYIEENANSETPWFLYHAFLAPHHPIEPAERFAREYDDTPEGKYRALVAQMDFSVGELMATLERTNSLENTIIVFLSDNGGTNKQLDNNYPFKGSKAEVFEGSYRTPLIIHWPAMLKSGLNDQIVHNIDIYPSLASALGLPLTEQLDGNTHWEEWLRTNAYGSESPIRAAQNHFRFWEKYHPTLGLMNFSVLSDDGRWRLSYDFQRNISLYDLESDPTGYRDVADKFPEQVISLKNDYVRSRYQQSRVAVIENPAEQRTITGFDQMRVSDEYSQTILFELLPGKDGSLHEKLLSQEGDWVISIDANRRVHFNSATISLGSPRSLHNECAVIGLTIRHKRPAFIGGPRQETVIKLYQDGLLQDVVELSSVGPRRQKWPGTVVNSTQVGKLRFFNQMAFGDSEPLPLQNSDSGENSQSGEKFFFSPLLKDLSKGLCQLGN